MPRILMPAFTVAEWGGLHENVLLSARALQSVGHEVTLVLRPGLITEKAIEGGFEVISVDWDDWSATAKFIRENVKFDLIVAQPQKSRELSLMVNEGLNKPIYVMFHGYYSDQAVEWSPKVTGFLPVTSLLAEFLSGFAKIPSWKISVVPNGVPADRFGLETRSFQEKVSANVLRVIVPSRIDKDKVYQQQALKELIRCIRETDFSYDWEIVVLGDGPEKRNFERLSRDLVQDLPNVSIRFTGWVDSEEVPLLMRDAFLTIGAGRGALQSLAVGTPVFAAGKYGVGGLQYGNNLRIGLWNNFGDYPFKDSVPTAIQSDFSTLFDSASYDRIQQAGRDVVMVERNQDVIDNLLVSSISY